MNLEINKSQLENLTKQLVKTTTSKKFLEEMHTIYNADAVKKYDIASDVANTNNLKSRGIDLPDTFRISLRNFELPLDTSKKKKEASDPMVCIESGCASVLYNGELVTISLENEASEKKYSQEQIQEVLAKDFQELCKFTTTNEFQKLLKDLYAVSKDKRREFVLNTILNADEVKKRGIIKPAEVYIRRSYFTDNRPTLFCVTKRTPLAKPWDKVTITYDNIT